MDDLTEDFKATLLSKQRSNLQKQYFAQDKTPSSVPVNIVSLTGEKLVPFRNELCLKTGCIYDLNDILDKFKSSENDDAYEFPCKFCDTKISLNAFLYDKTLAEEIDRVWNEHNTEEVLKITEVQQYKDGHCKLLKSESLSLSDNSPKSKSSLNILKRGSTEEDVDGEPREEKDASQLPKMIEFNKKEFSSLYSRFAQGRKDDMQRKIQPFGIEISKQQIDQLMSDSTTTSSIMTFFIRYIQDCSTRGDYIFPFIVDNFDKYEQKISFSYLQAFQNDFKKNLKGFSKDAQSVRIFLVYNYDERWMSACFDLKSKKCMLFDFLASDLSKISKDEISGIAKAFLFKEFSIKPSSFTFYDRAKSQTYNDCGLYVCKFLANSVLSSIELEKQSISDGERNGLKASIPWLMLRIHYKNEPEIREDSKEKGEGSLERTLSTDLKTINLGMRSYLEKGLKKPTLRPRNQLASLMGKYGSRETTIMTESTSILPDLKSQSKQILIQEEYEEKSRIPRSRFLEAIKDLKSEKESQMPLKSETLNNYLKASKSPQIKKIIEEADKANKLKAEAEHIQAEGPKEGLATNQAYLDKYNEYSKRLSDIYALLLNLQTNHQDLYERAAIELAERLDDNILKRFNIIQYKKSLRMNHQASSPMLSESSSALLPKKLPPISLAQKEKDWKDARRGIAVSKSQDTRLETSKDGVIVVKKKPTMPPMEPPPGASPRVLMRRKEPVKEIVAKRYGADVLAEELKALKEEDKIAESIFVFFFGYLQEKQGQRSYSELVREKLRILSLGPQFYERLTDNDPYSMSIKYDNVKDLTSDYQGKGSTIFEKFDKIVITVKGDEKHHMLIYIDNLERRIHLFDPSGKTDQSPVNHPILCNISQFIEMEYHNKADMPVNLARWRFIYGGTSILEDLKCSGILVAKIVSSMYSGTIQGHTKQEELKEFKKRLIALIEKVGVTKNHQNELGSLEGFPL